MSGQAISGAVGFAAPAGCITGLPIPLPSRKISRRWLLGWRSCATHTRLDAAAQQAQADEERAIKKVPAGGTRRRQKRNPHTSVDPLCRGGPPFAVKRGRLR